MFKRELKINFNNFLVWSIILLGLFLVVYLIYPSIINDESIKMLEEMMEVFPNEILMAFNMDISSISSAFGWLKSEGFVMVLLIMGCYAGILGSNILLKEENDKTIEYLNSLPIKRNKIIFDKVKAGLIYIVSMILIFGIFNFICLSLSGAFDQQLFILLSITPLFSSLVLFFLCLFISTFTHKTRKCLFVSLGITMISYMFNMFSVMSEETEFLKYFSVFTLADIRNVILNNSINPLMIFITVVLSSIFFILTIINYDKKELV